MAETAALPPCPHCGQDHPDTVFRCPRTDLPLPLPGRQLDEKFRILRELGRGGMGTVWLAQHIVVEREVAIKIVRPEVARSEQVQARFRAEAKAAGRIAHPNVCQILDFGIGPVGPYIVMERLHGASLAEVLDRLGTLTPEQLMAILRPVLEGLQAAHAQGIIHRDLKPENIFLHRLASGKTVVKLMDFGVAKFLDGSAEVETEQGLLLGTPQYMAPEQWKGASQASVQTDLWALGAILFRVLVGRDAFLGPTVAATLMKINLEDPPRLRPLVPAVSQALEDLVLRCLDRDPARRFDTAQSLLEAVDALGIPSAELPEQGFDPHAARVSSAVSSSDTFLPDPALAPTEASAIERAQPRAETRRRRWPRRLAMLAILGALGWWGSTYAAPWLEARLPFGLIARPPHDPAPTSTRGEPDLAGADPGEASTEMGTSAVDPEALADASTSTGTLVLLSESTGGELPAATSGSTGGEVTSGTTAPAEATGGSTGAEAATGSEDPGPAWVMAEDHVALRAPGPWGTHDDARRYCEALALTKHLGIGSWHLPNPTQAGKLARSPGVPRGRFWTSARWRGKVKVLSIPSGRLASRRADRKLAQPLCVAPARDAIPS